MSTSLPIGIIGCGGIAGAHRAAYEAHPEARIVALADPVLERAQRLAEETGGRAYADYREMLAQEELRGVSLCTPPESHPEIAVACLRAGVPVLCEKPLAADVPGAEAIVAAVEETGVPLMVAYCHRFHPPIRGAKRLLEEGRIGRPLLFRCEFSGYLSVEGAFRGNKRLGGGGCLMDNGSHAVDLFHFLIGPTRSVAGRAATVAQRIETEDVGVLLLEAEGPVFGTVTCSFSTPVGQAVVEIEGTEGSLRVSYWAGVPDLQVRTRHQEAWEAIPCDAEPDRFVAEAAHFLAAIQGREPLALTAADGLAVQRVIEAAYRSAASGEVRL